MIPLKKLTTKKLLPLLLKILFVFLISLLFAFGKPMLVTGNIFFGSVGLFYNVSIAQFFFMRAVDPLVGTVPLFAHYQLSRTYFIQGKLQQALTEANKELALYPENCRSYYVRGLTYGYMNYLDAAIKDFETFNSICVKDSWAGHNDLAWFYFRKGDMPKVIEVVRDALYKKENYLSPWLQNTYGVALMNTGAYKEASEAFRIAKFQAESMSDKDWGKAYPGNNPLVYQEGRRAMLESIYSNIKKNEELMTAKKP